MKNVLFFSVCIALAMLNACQKDTISDLLPLHLLAMSRTVVILRNVIPWIRWVIITTTAIMVLVWIRCTWILWVTIMAGMAWIRYIWIRWVIIMATAGMAWIPWV